MSDVMKHVSIRPALTYFCSCFLLCLMFLHCVEFLCFSVELRLLLLISPGKGLPSPGCLEQEMKLSGTGYTLGWLTSVAKHRSNWSYQGVGRGVAILRKEKLILHRVCVKLSSSGVVITWSFSPALSGAVASVRLNPGGEDYHGAGRQSDHHGTGGPAGDGSLHEPATQPGQQQSRPGHHDHTGGSAEPETGEGAADKPSQSHTKPLSGIIHID